MDKKDNERICLDRTFGYIPLANKEAKKVLEKIVGDISSAEEPDFIIDTGKTHIGVEHFLVDTLLGIKKGRKKPSRSRLRQYEITKTYEKYHDNLKGNEEKAIEDIQSIIQAEVDSIQNFDYSKFIKEFERITFEHLSKIEAYKEKNPEIEKMAFLIELSIAKNALIGLKPGKTNLLEIEKIKGHRIPFTGDMLDILKVVATKVDYTIICVTREDYSECPFMVYAFDNNNFAKSFDYQIKELYFKFTYDWQTYPFKSKVKIEYSSDNKSGT